MRIKAAPLVVAMTALALASGCGSGDDTTRDDSGAEAQAGGSGRCIDSWNRASRDVRAEASLTHRGDGADVQVGTYTGEPFDATGDFYDASGSPKTADVSVAPGDCVAVDLTGRDSETNWVMVTVKGGAGTQPGWYFLDATGDHPLAKIPQPIGEPVRTRIMGFGIDAQLYPGEG